MADPRVTLTAPEREELKGMLAEITNCLARMDAEKEHMSEIAGEAQKKFVIKKSLVNKLARTMYKHNYADVQSENEHFEYLYESVAEGKIVDDKEND